MKISNTIFLHPPNTKTTLYIRPLHSVYAAGSPVHLLELKIYQYRNNNADTDTKIFSGR